MSSLQDKLDPNNSPENGGVRRVNNVPLILIVGFMILFLALLGRVVFKRAASQKIVPTVAENATPTETSSLAEQVIGNHASGGIVPAALPLKTGNVAVPVTPIENLTAPPLPPRLQAPQALDSPLNAIQKARFQAFEAAVQAKTSLAVAIPYAHDTDENNTTAQIGATSSEDANTQYQQKLLALRAQMKGQPAESTALLQNAKGSAKDRWHLDSTLQAPESPYELRAGAVIPGLMISGINSDLPGQIMGQVSQNVYDTATGKYLLIPQGTHVIGTYDSHVVYGQSAVLIAWQRLVFPDGKAYDIGAMPGADSAGYAGFKDQVNNHYVRIFGSAFLMSGIVAGIAYSQDKNNSGMLFSPPTMSSALSQSLGQQLGEVTAQMVGKNLNLAPTIEIRSGYPFTIVVTKDMVFYKPYQSFDY